MSYQSVKIAQAPTLYYRLDQGGFGVNGETVPDLSGNDLHATLNFTGDAPAWGHASPIETDAASREFWGYTSAGIFGFSGSSFITRAHDSLLALGGGKDFTVGEWLRPMDTLPLAGSFAMVQKQGTGGTMLTVSGATRIGGFCFDSAATLFEVFDSSLSVDDHLGESFYVVVVRNGDALALYINGTLRNFTTITSGLPTLSNSNPFGIHPNAGAYTNARHDEAEYFTRALSGAEILESYNEALNALDIRLTANILTSAQINGSVEPDPIAYPFRHNWTRPVIERFRARTSVFKPTNGSTELARQRSSFRRQIEYQHLLYNEPLRRKFEARSFGGRTAYVQFEPDKVRLGSLLSAASTSLALDFTYMDFEIDHHALFYESDDKYEYKQLTNVTNALIEWDGSLTQDYAAHAFVKPVRIARLPISQDLRLHTDTIGETSTIYEYLPDGEPLSPRRIIPFVSTLTYQTEEAFDLAEWQGHDYSELPQIEFVSDRDEQDHGTGIVSAKQYRWGAAVVSPYRMILQSRETIAKYLGWIYARAGMHIPFWMPTFRNDLEFVSRSGSDLTVKGHEYTNLYSSADNRIDLAFVYFDNTTVMRRIVSSAISGANDVLTLDLSVPTPTNLRYLCFLRRVTLSSDDLEIAWETNSVVTTAFAVIDA